MIAGLILVSENSFVLSFSAIGVAHHNWLILVYNFYYLINNAYFNVLLGHKKSSLLFTF
jgi:hypothetical protein